MNHTTHVHCKKVCCITDCSVARNRADFSLNLMQSSLFAGSSYHPDPVTCLQQGVALCCASIVVSHTLVTVPWLQCLQVHQLGRYAGMLYSKGEMQQPVRTQKGLRSARPCTDRQTIPQLLQRRLITEKHPLSDHSRNTHTVSNQLLKS